jgi:hypothetical protein
MECAVRFSDTIQYKRELEHEHVFAVLFLSEVASSQAELATDTNL